MGSDRQSIMLHENGKKHKENVDRALQEKRINKQREDQAQKFLAESLKQMERAALGYQEGTRPSTQIISNNHYRPLSRHNQYQPPLPTVVGSSWSGPPSAAVHHTYQPVPLLNYSNTNKQLQQQEKIDWQAQKVKREEINTRKRKGEENDHDEDQEATSLKGSQITIRPDEGFYTYSKNNDTKVDFKRNDDATYLEGPIFFGLLCEEMPIQIWSGPSSCSSIEKRLPRKRIYWKNALVLNVKNSKLEEKDEDRIQRPSVHVSYLKELNDTEETIEKNVPVNRIRIILGSDKTIPDTVEASRLLILGGEEIQVTNNDNKDETIEATGLSKWSTVAIKKTSVLQENRDEKLKLKEQRRQVRSERDAEQKRAEARRMEEAKVSNADDSALGAYDVWGKGQYKGVDILHEIDCPVEDTAKRLAPESISVTDATGASREGKVSFRKRTKKKGAGLSRRRTSADD